MKHHAMIALCWLGLQFLRVGVWMMHFAYGGPLLCAITVHDDEGVEQTMTRIFGDGA